MLKTLHIHAEGAVRHLPVSPIFFGLFAFGTLSFLLYLVLRLDRE